MTTVTMRDLADRIRVNREMTEGRKRDAAQLRAVAIIIARRGGRLDVATYLHKLAAKLESLG